MLNRAVQGSTHTAQRVSWAGQDFTGATLSGILIATGGVERAITGDLTVVGTGLFDWTYSAEDVEDAGYFFVQFTADYGEDGVQSTLRTTWKVEE